MRPGISAADMKLLYVLVRRSGSISGPIPELQSCRVLAVEILIEEILIEEILIEEILIEEILIEEILLGEVLNEEMIRGL
uniref:Uncharacterized protein n=1 Tax=Knipowitschia caucasica TaxID=637954 RepID=A0AAV2KMG8_KNICA